MRATNMYRLRWLLLCILASGLFCGRAARSQQFPAQVRIVDRIDESNLVTLKGNTHPAANAKNDRGRVSGDLPMTDLVLVLSRDPAQQAAFEKFVASQYDSSSPDFHHWLQPEEVGARFGPSETDTATISNWLTGHGFTVDELRKDRMSIRFSGKASQVEGAFHVEMHNLEVAGISHIGNMSDPKIPAALATVVVGVKALHNFYPRPVHRMGSQVKLDAHTGRWQRISGVAASGSSPDVSTAGSAVGGASIARSAQPQLTVGAGGASPGLVEDVGPWDFANIYNILPLWSAGIDGTGQTIAIAGLSSINLADVVAFRTFFNLPTNNPANTPIIISGNGTAPAICSGSSSPASCGIADLLENSADVEWAGAIAKNAQIILVTSAQNSPIDDPLFDSESYIVNNRTAQIMSTSYGECELFLGTSGNVAYYNLWQTAAAEGIAVFVDAGDSGSPSCDAGQSSDTPSAAEFGLAVNGLASTPFTTTVGGTDFNWCSPAAAAECKAAPYWSPTSDATTKASALGYVPEVSWNDSCASPAALGILQLYATGIGVNGVKDAETACNFAANQNDSSNVQSVYGVDIGASVNFAAGGGASGCVVNDGANVSSCLNSAGTTGAGNGSIPLANNGWPKPSWQAGVTGIPNDGVRDIPDVSFFASDGFLSNSAYLICVSAVSPCTDSSQSEPVSQEYGGTSLATPAMAGVMALINQKAGAAQGNPNAELYKLAARQASSGCAAESATTGNGCYFNDIDSGTNAMACDFGAFGSKSPNCQATESLGGVADTVGVLPGYSAGTGYDLATGLGSPNVANVVNAFATPEDDPPPVIFSVSPVVDTVGTQTITILGLGFGVNTAAPYANQDSEYIRIYDVTGNPTDGPWSAGYCCDVPQDVVTLDVTKWSDPEIDVSGFDGGYGTHAWVLNQGDQLWVFAWNATTGAGPAICTGVYVDSGVTTYCSPNPAIAWGTPAPITYGTALSTQLDAVAACGGEGVPGTYAYTYQGSTITEGTSGTVLPAGSDTLSVTFTPDPGSFNPVSCPVQSTSVVLVVNPYPLQVHATNLSMPYGGPIPALTYQTITGFQNGDTYSSVVTGNPPTLTTTATVTSPPTPSGYPITFVPASEDLTAANYTFTYLPGTMLVYEASQTITFNPATPVTYGVPPIALNATASSGLPVTYSYVSGPGTLNGANNSTLTVTGVGSIVVQACQAGIPSEYYAAPCVNGTITVNPAVLTVTANSLSMPYGGPVPNLSYGITGFVNNDPSTVVTGTATLGTTATATSPVVVGGYPITFSTKALTAANYTFTYVAGVMTVTQDAQTITFNPATPVTYGVPPITLSATGGASGNPVTFTVVSGPGSLNGTSSTLTVTGAGNIMVQACQAGNQNYSAASCVTKTVVVSPALLTVTAGNKTMPYGGPLPTLTYVITGYVNNDPSTVVTGTASIGTMATTSSTPGPYPITVTQGSLSAANYTFTFVNATLTVTQAGQTITFNPATPVTYGVLPITLSATGGASGNPVTFSVTSGPGSLNGTSSTLTVTGAGNIMVQACQAGNTDYTAATCVTKTIVVNAATLTVTATSFSMPYLGPLPNLTYVITGYVNNDPSTVVTGTAALFTSATASSPVVVGGYPIIFTTEALTASNYTFVYVPGVLTITQLPQTIIFNPTTPVTYGVPPITLSATGGASGNPVTFAYVSGPGSLSGTNNSTLTVTGAGSIVVKACQAGNQNYSAAACVNGTIVVSAAVLTVTAANLSMPYGGPVPALTYGITGYVNGDPSTVVTGTASIGTMATTSSPPGLYPITVTQGSLSAG
ncbi:MAG: MBG domain-containing protein, partial [Terracidiphilus sp.]